MSNIRAVVGMSKESDPRAAVEEAVRQAHAGIGDAALSAVVLATTIDHAPEALAALADLLPGVPVHGATSSLGVLGRDGVTSGSGGASGVLLLAASGGARVVVGSSAIDGDARRAGAAAARLARQRAGAATPRLVLMNASPGHEEDLLAGIADELPNVPVFGGSAADNAIAGDWSVFTETGRKTSAVSLLAFCGDLRAGGAIVAPYAPTGRTATITAVDDRLLEALDGKPAATVLGQWLDGAIDFQVKEGGNILAQTALRPLGVRRAAENGEHYVTIHPAAVRSPAGSVDLFARAHVGEVVCSMRGSPEELIDAIPRLVERALASSGLSPAEVKAGVLIYCAGCAGAVGGRLHDGLKKHLGAALGDAACIGLCTFGEQGHVPGVGNVHQDLSLSLMLVG